jgi:hypothetical protein
VCGFRAGGPSSGQNAFHRIFPAAVWGFPSGEPGLELLFSARRGIIEGPFSISMMATCPKAVGGSDD